MKGYAVTANLCVLIIALWALTSACKNTEHLDRAKEMLSRGAWTAARSELDQQLRREPHDDVARGLALYCLAHDTEFPPSKLYALYQLASTHDGPGWRELAANRQKKLDDWLVTERKRLYDQGIDTRDHADLARVVLVAARESFAHDTEAWRKDAAAAILAYARSTTALDYLIERLKSADTERTIRYLAELGPSAEAALRPAINDPSALNHRAAIEVGVRIHASRAAGELIRSQPDRGTLPSAALARLPANALSSLVDPSLYDVHAQYLALEGAAADSMVVLQHWSDQPPRMLTDVFVARGASFDRLRVLDHGAPYALSGEGVVVSLSSAGNQISLERWRELDLQTERDAPSGTRLAAGQRVRIRNYEPHGKIVREDQGLWQVALDTPIHDMGELTVASDALIALTTMNKRVEEHERLTGSLNGDAFELASRTTTQSDAKP